jgi:transaldolase
VRVNVTLCFSPVQALLAAKAGATYISPFLGRVDDVSEDGLELLRQIVHIYANYDFPTQILAASIRSPFHVLRAAELGAHCATMPITVIRQLPRHPLTDIGLAKFLADARDARRS